MQSWAWAANFTAVPRSTQPCIPPRLLNRAPASAGGKGGNVTSVGWRVTLCDPIWHVSSCSGVAMLHREMLYPYTILYFIELNYVQDLQSNLHINAIAHPSNISVAIITQLSFTCYKQQLVCLTVVVSIQYFLYAHIHRQRYHCLSPHNSHSIPVNLSINPGNKRDANDTF